MVESVCDLDDNEKSDLCSHHLHLMIGISLTRQCDNRADCSHSVWGGHKLEAECFYLSVLLYYCVTSDTEVTSQLFHILRPLASCGLKSEEMSHIQICSTLKPRTLSDSFLRKLKINVVGVKI